MAGEFVGGFDGDITIGGTAMKVKSWSAKIHIDEIDVTRKGDGGWRAFTTGLMHAEGSFEYAFDVAIHATGTLPKPIGRTLATFNLSMDDSVGGNDGGAFTFSGYVFDCEFSNPVDNIVMVTGNFKSSGPVNWA